MFPLLLAFLNLQIYFPVIFFVTNVTRHHIIIYSLQESEKKTTLNIIPSTDRSAAASLPRKPLLHI